MTGFGAGESVVTVEKLSVVFGRFRALSDVTFSLPKGTVVGLVGPNGAGKTTLMRVLATLLVPASGSAAVGGCDVVKMAGQVRGEIGYLPDFGGIYQDMRAREYLSFFAAAYGLRPVEIGEYIERVLALVGLTDRIDDFVENLSLGMRLKLAFARTLAGDPSLLILDEPLAGLDHVARGDMLDLLSDMRSRGKTIIISSHLLSDLEKVCDRILFLDGGALVREPVREGETVLYELETADPPENLLEILETVNGVLSVETQAGAGRLHRLELSSGDEISPVLRALLDRGLDVVMWRPVKEGLEERFRRALKEDES